MGSNKAELDLAYLRFGKLTPVYRIDDYIYPDGRHRKSRWLCFCDCGMCCAVQTSNLTGGRSTTCGCSRIDNAKERGKKIATHNESRTRLYNIWAKMLERCYNEKRDSYKRYGARGIIVCDEWKTYIPFSEWSKSHGYADNLTLDRIDYNGNYCPENCRWVDWDVQQNNRSSNRPITYNGVTKNIKQWAREYGINRTTLSDRLERGWSVHDALNIPAKPTVKPIEFNGRTMSLPAWNKETGIPYSVLRSRIWELNWDVEKALTLPSNYRTMTIDYNGFSKTLNEWSEVTGVPESTLYARIHTLGWSIKDALTTPVGVRRQRKESQVASCQS